jgi:hypothetical protein
MFAAGIVDSIVDEIDDCTQTNQFSFQAHQKNSGGLAQSACDSHRTDFAKCFDILTALIEKGLPAIEPLWQSHRSNSDADATSAKLEFS